MPKVSLRKCLICRKSDKKANLLRFVVGHQGIVWDREERMPGRGAYLHRYMECYSKLVEPGRWEHALKLPSGLGKRQNLAELLDEVHGFMKAQGNELGGPNQ